VPLPLLAWLHLESFPSLKLPIPSAPFRFCLDALLCFPLPLSRCTALLSALRSTGAAVLEGEEGAAARFSSRRAATSPGGWQIESAWVGCSFLFLSHSLGSRPAATSLGGGAEHIGAGVPHGSHFFLPRSLIWHTPQAIWHDSDADAFLTALSVTIRWTPHRSKASRLQWHRACSALALKQHLNNTLFTWQSFCLLECHRMCFLSYYEKKHATFRTHQYGLNRVQCCNIRVWSLKCNRLNIFQNQKLNNKFIC
jgi:hypothetical protein